MVMLRAEDIERIVQNALKPIQADLKSIKEDTKDTCIKVNQMYDSMERQGYQFPAKV